jgi:hypothetical protein
MPPKGPYKLCTVNTAPERAKKLVGRVVEDVKGEWTIMHVANAEREFLLSFCFSFFFSGNFGFGGRGREEKGEGGRGGEEEVIRMGNWLMIMGDNRDRRCESHV